MLKRIAIVGILAILVVARIEGWIDKCMLAAVVVVLLGLALVGLHKSKQWRTSFDPDDDDDGGMDWREDGGENASPQMWNGWCVLLDDCAVFEAKEAAERLEAAGLRCRLEALHEDHAYHRYGNGGMGTRMCVLVPPSEYDGAVRIMKSTSRIMGVEEKANGETAIPANPAVNGAERQG